MNFRLKLAIIAKFRNQKRFAAVVGDSPYIVTRTIRGKTVPSDERKKRYANALGKSVEELFESKQ